ncbi:MAG TPA: DUF3891 family protein [Candidatus Angelobacter sp.]
MILGPLEPSPAMHREWVPAWPVVERLQRQKYQSCWMITQPSHAAFAGDLAARLTAPQIPTLEAELVRAIALHDAGWGMPDAQAVMRSRSSHADPPRSFLDVGVAEFLEAWTQSIEIAQPVLPAGGYIVSRHFWRLAEHRLAHGDDGESDRKKLQTFLSRETQRQKRLASKQARSAEELELLTDVLQFCDLLSLYVCSGARDSVRFPEYFGVTARLSVVGEGYKLDPPLVASGVQFSVARLRHPATKEKSGEEMRILII